MPMLTFPRPRVCTNITKREKPIGLVVIAHHHNNNKDNQLWTQFDTYLKAPYWTAQIAFGSSLQSSYFNAHHLLEANRVYTRDKSNNVDSTNCNWVPKIKLSVGQLLAGQFIIETHFVANCRAKMESPNDQKVQFR